MMFFWKNIFLVLFYILFSLFSQGCSSGLIDKNNYDKTLRSLQAAYRSDEYVSLDKALSSLLEKNSILASGKSGQSVIYNFFRQEMSGSGANAEDSARMKKWKKAVPDSIFPRFGELRLMYAQAWNARGNEYAKDTRQEQFHRFKKGLLQTEAAILATDNKLKETAFLYNLLMSVQLDTNGVSASAIDTFKEGVKKWPHYYRFYEALLNRTVPKWGGSWEDVDRLIAYAVASSSKLESSSVYARLYYSVHSHEEIDPRKTSVEWRKLKASLISLYTRYPVKEHFEISASYACMFSDYDFYNSLINENHVSASRYWLRGSSLENCNKYFSKFHKPRVNKLNKI